MSVYEFKLPDVGEGLSEGEIVKWHAAVGDQVVMDQLLVEIQTDKAIVEIPSPVSGTVTGLGGAPNDVLPIGAMLATFEVTGAAAEETASAAVPIPVAASSEAASADLPLVQAGVSPTGVRRTKASPATRKFAREMGVDLAVVTPTGSRGQVTRADVEQAKSAPTQPSAPRVSSDSSPTAVVRTRVAVSSAQLESRSEPLRGLRRQIALTMEEAWRTVPHIFSMDSLDATALVSVRQRLNEDLAADGVKLSFLPFFVKACAAALRAEPRFNASLDMANERIHYHGRVNIGIATQTAEGLIVTVVHDADQLGLVDIAIEIEALAQAARDRKIRLEQLADATFSISNYGSYGGHLGTPIIRPPECAIAGFGRLHDAVVPRDGVPVVQPTLPFCVSADHRLNDGEDLGRFIDVMRRYLHDPIRLLGLR